MAVLAIARWVLLHLLRSPGIAAAGVLGFGAVLLLAALRPLESPEGALAAARAWAHPAGLIGATAALVTLSRGEPFLVRVDPRTRFLGELAALLAGAIYMQLPIVAGAALAGLAPGELARAAPAILSADLSLASVALLVLLPACSTAVRASLFLAAAALVPALGAGAPRLARLTALVDAGVALREPAAATLLPTLAAACSLVLVSYLLRTGAARGSAG